MREWKGDMTFEEMQAIRKKNYGEIVPFSLDKVREKEMHGKLCTCEICWNLNVHV